MGCPCFENGTTRPSFTAVIELSVSRATFRHPPYKEMELSASQETPNSHLKKTPFAFCKSIDGLNETGMAIFERKRSLTSITYVPFKKVGCFSRSNKSFKLFGKIFDRNCKVYVSEMRFK
ncbi:hypothetical protein TNIN_309161 [Trichonephila inaurata madagascariensis]|uniref:Uncharacterized protein n=1 Tax=Trichonephila inaurata madagascariensis TaxID=2747483 RepID=A0A8X6XXY6_9ARAC|nr:hypothetical protein TNIN_309161 [Trichonephila inaurata madagascariensis]